MKSIQNNSFAVQAQKYDFCFVVTLEYYYHMGQEFTLSSSGSGTGSTQPREVN